MDSKRVNNFIVLAAIAVVLTACNQGGDDASDEPCLGSVPAGSQIATDAVGCQGCEVSAESSAIDGQRDSFEAITFDRAGGQVNVRMTAPDGVSFAAGRRAGAIMNFPYQPNFGFTNTNLRVRTYLDGLLQETLFENATVTGNIENAGTDTFYGDTTGQPFDAVELDFGLSDANPDATVLIYEMCTQH